MILSYFRLAIRTFLRNKVAFTINLVGMSIALGCCIAAWVNYEFNAEFDNAQANAPQLYRVSFIHQAGNRETPYGVIPLPMANLLRESLGEADDVIRYISRNGKFRIGDEMFEKEFVYADPAFTRIFTIEMKSGTNAMADKTGVLISDKLARTYFGTEEVLGRGLTQIISGNPREYVITGVFKAFPYNSSFRFDLLTTYENYFADAAQRSSYEGDWSKWTTAFLYVKNADAIGRMTPQLAQYLKPQNEARPDLQARNFYIEPFIGMATRAVRDKIQGHWMNMPMPPAAVFAPFAMAGFLLLVACFNFTNNAIAVAGKRLKEIGIRKVIGGRRKELIFQFMAESLVFCLIALVCALLMGEYFVAGWDSLWPGIELTVRYANNAPFMIMLAALTLVTALLAGAYPAFYISAFKPVHVLKGTTRFGGMNLFTKGLLVFQFSISLAAVIFALAFYFNSRFQKSYDLGYDYRSVIQVPVESRDQFIQLRNALMMNAEITALGGAEHHIYSSSYKASAKQDTRETEVDVLNIGDDYFKTLGVRVLAGRGFQAESAADARESIIVNEEFVRVMKLEGNPVGQRVLLNDTLPVYVVGVAKDVYLQALFQPLSPIVFRYTTEDQYKYLVASTDPSNLVNANEQIRNTWKNLFPYSLYTGRLMEQRMVMVMEHFDNVIVLYTFLGIVAIVMSVSGLFSLVSINLQKRTKELGVRKILGSSLGGIVLQASKLFLSVMAVSFVIGSLFGSWMVNKLMDSIWEYYVAIDVPLLMLSIGILFAIASLTVSMKILKVARTNPADSLRYE